MRTDVHLLRASSQFSWLVVVALAGCGCQRAARSEQQGSVAAQKSATAPAIKAAPTKPADPAKAQAAPPAQSPPPQSRTSLRDLAALGRATEFDLPRLDDDKIAAA